MCRECRERFPHHRGLAIPTYITARASRTCRDACRDRYLTVSFEVGCWENVLGIPGACTTRNFMYLVRGPLSNSTLTKEHVCILMFIDVCIYYDTVYYHYEYLFCTFQLPRRNVSMQSNKSTVGCRYNVIQYNKIFHTALQ